ncbi:hypothetical protein B0T18DRAFT_410089 [Schizothecium vesticola]|uniref:Uncharacterized protein n=1 Tax=Schizothecium vesticola TaxID=314040 RepID=A0AA40EUD3_9PEZI|nr:hypothetical protein B0T18DRAFT_410089 [Schizothecium vesticola]
MSARTIEYIWKVARPKNEAIARALMYAAYQTAMQTDPNTTQVLIRSYIPPSIRTGGIYRKDNPHITLSLKNMETAREGKHQTTHGYTPHINSFNVEYVVPSIIKDDAVGNAWPADMETKLRDIFTGELGPLGLAENFFTWPFEKAGK